MSNTDILENRPTPEWLQEMRDADSIPLGMYVMTRVGLFGEIDALNVEIKQQAITIRNLTDETKTLRKALEK